MGKHSLGGHPAAKKEVLPKSSFRQRYVKPNAVALGPAAS